MKSHRDFAFWSIALALLIVVSALHFWGLGSAPRGFFGDEAINAYNGYSITITGADEYAVRHPVFFRCFGDYHDPVSIYCLAPLVSIFGLTPGVSRLPSALFGLAAIVAFGFLVLEYCRNRWLALFGAIVFAIVPWAFPVSRTISGGYTAMLLGMNLGWLCSLRALRQKSHRYALAAGIGWAFAMYAHNIGRPMTAIWLIGCVLVLNRLLTKRWRLCLSFVISFVLCLTPMIVNVLHNPQSMSSRFSEIGLFHDRLTLADAFHQFATRYLGYFSPQFLFLHGDTNFRHHTGFGGELFLSTMPFILMGLFCVICFWKQQPYYRLLGATLVLYPVAAALTIDKMHAGRSMNGVIPWTLLTMVGAHALWRRRHAGRTFLLIICAAGIFEGAAYLADYFGPYQTRSSAAYQTGLTKALEYCFSRVGSNQTFYVSGSVGTASFAYVDTNFKPFIYAYLLFHGKIDPWSYQHSGFSNTVVQPYFERIDHGPGLLLRCNNTPSPKDGRLIIVPNVESIPPNAKILTTFQDETLVYQIWEVK